MIIVLKNACMATQNNTNNPPCHFWGKHTLCEVRDSSSSGGGDGGGGGSINQSFECKKSAGHHEGPLMSGAY